ncbi:MAG: PIG-L deacetylase family protein [Bacteroidota bacterium]
MFHDIQRVLVLAPHPDDAEFGLGGTIAKLKELGKEIHVAVFSDCEKSTPSGFANGSIEAEFYQSMELMNIPKEHIHFYRFEVRIFPALRQEILEQMVSLRNEINPDLVFLPSSSDLHQDHATIHAEGIRAFKHQNILGYEMPWNNFAFKSYMYVKLEEKHIEAKIAAINVYKTQAHRPYSANDFVRSLANIRAIQINAKHAESFEVIRFIQN